MKLRAISAGMTGILLILLFLSFGGYGQSCEDNINKMNTLYKEGKISEAIIIGEKALPGCKIELGVESLAYVSLLNSLAILYTNEGNYLKAQPLFLEALEVNEKIFGPEDSKNLVLLTNLASIYQYQGNLSKAEILVLKGLDITKRSFGTENENYALLLRKLALIYFNQGHYSKAELLFMEALELIKRTVGINNNNYGITLANLAELYIKEGKTNEAQPLCYEALDVCKKVFGVEHPEYATMLNNVAILLYKIGDYGKVESILLEVLRIREKSLGNENLDYANSLNSLGIFYTGKGDYKKAKPFLSEAIRLRKKILGVNHPDYADAINSLAKLYERENDFQNAELLFSESLEIKKKVYGDTNPEYLSSLSDLARFYKLQGNYRKAESLYITIKEKYANLFGIENPTYVSLLIDFAQLYIEIYDFSKAEDLLLQSLWLQEKISGKVDPEYMKQLAHLGVLYCEMGKFEQAESYLKEALSLTEKNLGEQHLDFIRTLNIVSALYFREGKYLKSEKNLSRAISIIERAFGTNHPDYFMLLENLASIYFEQGKYEKGVESLVPVLGLQQKQLSEQTSYQSNSELNAYLNKEKLALIDSKFSLLYPFKIINNTINQELFNTVILLKNLTLRNRTQVQYRIKQSNDTALTDMLEEFQSLKRKLNKYAILPKSEQPKNLIELEEAANSLEKQLVKSSQAFKESQDFTNTRWQDVQKSLKKDEAAIEFVSFRYYNRKWTDSILYAAMVIRPNYSFPKIIPLFEQKQLDSLMKRNPSLPEENYLNNLYSKENFGLYNLIGKPIDSLLRGVTTIYAAPSGSLYNLNLAQIMSDKPGGGSFNVHILGTTGGLPKYSALQINNTAISSAVVFGGVNYDTASNSGISFTPPVYTPGFEQVASITNRGGTTQWSYLPGTLTEATQIAKINTEAGVKVTLLKGDEANESTFKNLNGFSSPYILHLATHGYFFPNPVPEKPKDFNWQGAEKKLVYKWSEDPLLRSGLILAGANKAWQNSAFITDSTEDGILTSMEVANVDLSNCKLAVLSACETGLGDINGSEGVFGLQRGFKLAGVKNIIMSLWRIPDAQSAELLELFYQNCFRGLTVHESLKQAQKAMSEKYPPYYWAGFVLLE